MRKHRCIALILLCSALLAIGCGEDPEKPPAAAPSPETQTEGVIVAMGDSLTEGLGVGQDSAYPAVLEKKLRAQGYRFEVVNAGVSGETSSGALDRVDWILTLNPDIVILETGANDGLRGLDVQKMRQNMEAIVSRLQSQGVVVVLAGMKMFRNLGPDYVEAFEQVYRDLADKYDLILIPFMLEGVAGHASLNQADGIHPNAAGHRKVADTMYPYIVEAIGQVPSNLALLGAVKPSILPRHQPNEAGTK